MPLDRRRFALLSTQLLVALISFANSEGNGEHFLFDRKLLAVDVADRIAGGENAVKGRFPYSVSLRQSTSTRHFCGGVLIDDDLILTAAHCVDGREGRSDSEPHPTLAIGGTKYKYQEEEDGDVEVRKTCKTIIHAGFDGKTRNGNDIALMFLDKKVTKMRPVKELASPTSPSMKDGLYLYAIGFGQQATGAYPDYLQVAKLEYVDNDFCTKSYNEEIGIDGTMLCAEGGNMDTCRGDSGGGLVFTKPGVDGKPEDVLIGLTSFGPRKCGDRDTPPGVYVRVSEFIKWVKDRGDPDKDQVIVNAAVECAVTVEGPKKPPSNFPDASRIVGLIEAGKKKEAAKEIVRAANFGEYGRNVLDEAIDVSIEKCIVAETASAVVEATNIGGKSVEDHVTPLLEKLKDAIDKECGDSSKTPPKPPKQPPKEPPKEPPKQPPKEAPKPPPEPSPNDLGDDLLKAVKNGTYDKAGNIIVKLIGKGDSGIKVVKDVTKKAIKGGSAEDMSRAFVFANKDGGATVDKVSGGLLDDLYVEISITEVKDILLIDGKTSASSASKAIAEVANDKANTESHRKTVILEGTKRAVSSVKQSSKKVSSKTELIARILLDAANVYGGNAKILEGSHSFIIEALGNR